MDEEFSEIYVEERGMRLYFGHEEFHWAAGRMEIIGMFFWAS